MEVTRNVVCSQGRWGEVVPQETEPQLLSHPPKKTNLGVVADTPGNICLHFYAAVWTQHENCCTRQQYPFPTRQSLGTRPLPLRALKVSRNFGRGDTIVSDNLFECSICLFPIRLNLASPQAPEFPSSFTSASNGRTADFPLAHWNPAAEMILALLSERGQLLDVSLII